MAVSVSDQREISVVCRNCHLETKRSVEWLRAHFDRKCSTCGKPASLESFNLRTADPDTDFGYGFRRPGKQ